MKKVIVTYFKESGKYYTEEEIEISEEVNGYQALWDEIPPKLRLKDMIAVVRDSEDSKEPYIVPQLYPIKR